MTKQEFISLLNEDLEYEYQSLVQYVLHIASIKGAAYQQTLSELSAHLGQELNHALVVAKQIDFLGGVPTTRVPEVEPLVDGEEALQQDLQLETRQLERYRERVEQATNLGLPDVGEALSPILQETQDHTLELQNALGQ